RPGDPALSDDEVRRDGPHRDGRDQVRRREGGCGAVEEGAAALDASAGLARSRDAAAPAAERLRSGRTLRQSRLAATRRGARAAARAPLRVAAKRRRKTDA